MSDSPKFTCPPTHKHGSTSNCYCQHRCRCADCVTSRSEAERSTRRLKAYGRFQSQLVDSSEALEHVLHLIDFGMGCRVIARLSDTNADRIFRLAYGDTKTGKSGRPKSIRRDAAERILAVKPDLTVLAPNALIPTRGARRRIEALMAIGWSRGAIAERAGMWRSNLARYQDRDFITVRNHMAIAAVFDQLWETNPADGGVARVDITKAKNYAAAHGWVPPLAWDDIDNDPTPPVAEPDSEIDEVAVELALRGEKVALSYAERRVAVVALHAEKFSDAAIAETLRVSDRTVLRIRQELGLESFPFSELRFAA